jgi:glycerol-3-phosphate dehydrogenase
MTNPLQVAAYLIEKLSQHNTTILEHTSAISVAKSSSGFLSVRSNSGELFEARAVVSTLGPWVGTVQLSSELQPGPRPLWCKGFNLIINRQLDPRYGIGFESRDGRLFFCTPRDQGTAIGTWYLPYADDPSTVSATQSDITNFLDAFNQAVPGASISPTEVVALDVGVLPMTGISPRGPKLQAHETITNHQNFIEVISTKYTTFRSQGQRVVRAIGAAAVR